MIPGHQSICGASGLHVLWFHPDFHPLTPAHAFYNIPHLMGELPRERCSNSFNHTPTSKLNISTVGLLRKCLMVLLDMDNWQRSIKSMHASLLTWVYLNMQKQHVTLHDQFSRVKMLQMGACFVWKENPGGSNPFFMNVGPGISADIGARIILAPSFGISLEDMKTKIKGRCRNQHINPICLALQLVVRDFWGYILFDLMQIEYIWLSWTQEIMMKRIPYLFSGRCTKNISRAQVLENLRQPAFVHGWCTRN